MNEQLPYIYETEVAWKGARKGELQSPSLPTLEVASPPEFKGHEATWTPEHLYVAAVNVCYMTTFLAIAELAKLDFATFTCKARGILDKDDAYRFRLSEIILHPQLVIHHSRDLERAGRLLEKAEANCLISNSVNTVVKLRPEISFAEVKEQAQAVGAS